MKYKYLGKTGVQVSALSFGTMTFGKEADKSISEQLYKRCREAGINFFDCADTYQIGLAEEILGKFVKPERHEIILTSKVYFPCGKNLNDCGLSRRHIMQSIEGSLKRLGTDYIDIYYMHRFDDKTPLEESLRAMNDLVAQGKVVYLGVSNFAAWQIMKGLGISALNHWSAFSVIQPMYNLLKRQAEVEIFPMAQAENLAVVPYNPLGGGMLTGKYLKQNEKQQGRFFERKMYHTRYMHDSFTSDITEKFVKLAKDKGFSPAALAIAWAASHPAVVSPILGARNLDQLNECLKSTEIDMTEELRKEISALTPEIAVATDRSEELHKDPMVLHDLK